MLLKLLKEIKIGKVKRNLLKNESGRGLQLVFEDPNLLNQIIVFLSYLLLKPARSVNRYTREVVALNQRDVIVVERQGICQGTALHPKDVFSAIHLTTFDQIVHN